MPERIAAKGREGGYYQTDRFRLVLSTTKQDQKSAILERLFSGTVCVHTDLGSASKAFFAFVEMARYIPNGESCSHGVLCLIDERDSLVSLSEAL